MYLVDTNIFLEVMLSRGRKDECKRFLGLLRDGRASGVVTDFSVHSIMVVLDSLGRRQALRTFLASLAGYRGLHIHYTTLADEVRAVDLAERHHLDIDDAVQYAVAISTRAQAIVSFDRDFDGLEIPRLEPRDVVERLSRRGAQQ